MQKTHLPPLFIGRFQPFHLGHLDAIKQILAKHKKIIIGIGSAQYEKTSKNPFAAKLRKKMIEKSLLLARVKNAKFIIKLIPDINDDNLWVTHAEKLCPRFGDVWSGTPLVQKLFRKDGKHKVIAPVINIPVSGTKVRKLMKRGQKWKQFVPDPVIKILV